MKTRIVAAVLLGAVLGMPGASAQDAAREGLDFFEKRIRPVLVEKCYKCHSGAAGKVKGDLYLDSREGLLRGGETGPSIVPGDPDKSLLIKAVRHNDETLEMPPKEEDKLTPEQVADFVAWVKMGAPDPRASGSAGPQKPAIDMAEARKFWSFHPVADPAPPAVKNASWIRNPIDRFILARLEEKGVAPASDADRRALLRRATYDLAGLPPTPGEIDAFLADPAPDAFARVVERLLASPHYGERWGRHWLDVVRYADTAGCNSDYPIPQMYRYRNYVIDAFNRDMPYDRFIREQLAGDLVPSETEAERHERLIATGYLANSRRFASSENGIQHLIIEDTLDNLGRTFLGLTVNCARCHDHKYDPVTNEDYYALYGFFQSTRYPFPGVELNKVPRDLVPLLPQEKVDEILRPFKDRLAAHDAEVKRLNDEQAALRKVVTDAEEARKAFDARRAQAVKKDGATADPDEERIRRLEKDAGDARKRLEGVRNAAKEAAKKKDQFAKTLPILDSAYAVADAKACENAKVHVRGEPKNPGREVPRRFLEVLGGAEVPKDEKGSGRLHLAAWLADPANPLTARVMVNRIWLWHFGRGLVATPSDFGARGQRPSHPELLDWLAKRFVESGWSIKAMHRLIMLSRIYQLASAGTGSTELYARFERRRLEAEEIRDAMLAVSGTLDRTPGGPHPFPPQATWEFTQHVPFSAVYETNRRSVYVMIQRIKKHPFFVTFDGADTNASTPQRGTSTTPLQALLMMNDPFVHDRATDLAVRLLKERPDDAARVELAYMLSFGRPPTTDERSAAERHLADVRTKLRASDTLEKRIEPMAWASFARVVFRLNEFIYID